MNKFKVDTDGRIERAKTEKIYLVNRNINNDSALFDVMGSSGKIYQVKLSGHPTCTCPDHSLRKSRCKHILFILVRIFKLDNPYQEKFIGTDIIKYINLYKDNISKLNKKYNMMEKCIDVGAKCLDNECAICLDLILNGEKYVYCKQVCGKCIHEECYDMIIKTKIDKKCVYCQNTFVKGIIN